jgi:hypothetical protein
MDLLIELLRQAKNITTINSLGKYFIGDCGILLIEYTITKSIGDYMHIIDEINLSKNYI